MSRNEFELYGSLSVCELYVYGDRKVRREGKFTRPYRKLLRLLVVRQLAASPRPVELASECEYDL